jgi:hypothetical protein
MNKQSNEIEWIPISLLLDKIRYLKKRYNSYSIAILSNNNRVIIDNRNLRALVIDGSYFAVVNDFEKWLNKGFIVIQHGYEGKYYVLNTKDGSITRISNMFDPVAQEFLEGKIDYFIWRDMQGKYAIFDKEGKQISKWFDFIDLRGLVFGHSDYYIVKKDGKRAIFHKNGNQISDWLNWIEIYGLVEGKSEYYIAGKDGKVAIFHKDREQISDWFDFVSEDGLVEGKSEYYVAGKNGQEAIFHKDSKKITQWFYSIGKDGLVKGESDYYIAKKDDKYAIFHKDGRQITDWFDYVYPSGLVNGESDYYVAFGDDTENRKARGNVIYIGKLGSLKLYGPLKDISWDSLGFIRDSSNSSIVVYTLDGKRLDISKVEIDQFFKEGEKDYERTK